MASLRACSVQASGHTSEQCLFPCEKRPFQNWRTVSPPPSQPEKLKIKSKPSSGFGCCLAQPLAGSAAPTFHDFKTFQKPTQLQGEEGKRRKLPVK